MYLRFLKLEWKSFFRSASFGKSLGLRILLIFLALYFAVSFLVLGTALYPILKDAYPNEDPLILVNNMVLAWLVFELIYRFMLQSLPVIDIKPLLILPVSKPKVVNFLLLKSLYSFYNILPLFVIIPFGLFCIYTGDYSKLHIVAWMFAISCLSLCVNYFNFIIKKQFTENLKALIPLVVIIAALAALDYYGIVPLRIYFGKALGYLAIYPALTFISLILVAILFYWNKFYLQSKFYLDAGLKEKQKEAQTQDFLWTRKLGSIAPFLQLDLKLIWRNKRPKAAIYMSLIFLFYGMIFYPNDTYQEMPSFFIFVGIFITGVFMINFGQFVPSWDASYYPMIMTQNIPVKEYLASKAALISFSIVVLAILATPYVYFGWDIFLINLICALYNLGVNVPVLLFSGAFNRKRIDLDKSPFMNYQGMGAAQWLVSIPLMALPVFIFWLVQRFSSFEIALAVLGLMGAAGLLLRSILFEKITGLYVKNKYEMIQGFKQSGE